MNEFLTIITARGGSKRLPNKNILQLGTKPLIAHTIIAAKNSKYLDKIMVTTDSLQIADISTTFGAEVPFIRPKELATDTATSVDVIKHAINHYYNQKQYYKYLVLLQPTSPFRDAIEIDNAIKLLKEKNADAIISVKKASHSPIWSNVLPNDLSMNNFLDKKYQNIRSQDLPQYYSLNGAIYICNIEKFLSYNSLFLDKNIYAYIMDEYKSIDIDTQLDFEFANFLIQTKYNKNIN